MMGSENPGFEEAHLFTSREEMENLVLDDLLTTHHPNNNNSYSSFRSANSSISESTHHPLSPPVLSTSADSDPLLSPPVYRNPNASDNNSYIEPHSYADVIISPFDENSASEINCIDSTSQDPDSSFALSKSSSSSSNYIKIMVSNPKKEQETTNSLVPGGKTYYTYLITTRTNIPDFGSSEFSVRRRFRDVVTLSDRLAEAYHGYFIPPRPDKNVVESQVEGRLPLSMSTDVASRMLDRVMVAPHEAVQPAKGGKDLLRLFKELRQSVANDWGGSKPPVVEEDKVFMENKESIHDLEQQISNASQQAETLVKAQQDMGETMGELGLTFIKLTKFENEEAMYNSQRVRAADMKCVATAAVKASRFYRELNAQTVKHLDTLHEYLGLMLAVHGAFTDRSSALLTVQTLLSELSTLHSRAEKLEAASSKIFGGDKSRIHKIKELKETIRITEDAKNVTIREYEWIKENNKCELERLDKERRVDFLNMLKGFVVNQVILDSCFLVLVDDLIVQEI
ncbi:hypothetical protein V6N13_001181 [Hibiscus sabdariffa]|uniref:PX domain-containing protein n=1 Tax=Hibiscus sabdariffa TaxID=183260 RepID=A0ABR2G7K2_9ROSI